MYIYFIHDSLLYNIGMHVLIFTTLYKYYFTICILSESKHKTTTNWFYLIRNFFVLLLLSTNKVHSYILLVWYRFKSTMNFITWNTIFMHLLFELSIIIPCNISSGRSFQSLVFVDFIVVSEAHTSKWDRIDLLRKVRNVMKCHLLRNWETEPLCMNVFFWRLYWYNVAARLLLSYNIVTNYIDLFNFYHKAG